MFPGNPITCCLGLRRTASIQSISAVRVTRQDNGTLLQGIAFEPNENTQAFFKERFGGEWQGFAGRVQTMIPSNIAVQITFDLNTETNATTEQLARELADAGITLGMGSSDDRGVPTDPTHFQSFDPDPGNFTVPTRPGRVQIIGGLSNFDVRYPTSLPNDLEIVLYGEGLTTNSVTGAWRNSEWGSPTVATSVGSDASSPGYGLDCVVVRYSGDRLPNSVGHLLHFGVRLRPGTVIAHQEIWWTLDSQPVVRPCDPRIQWICTPGSWLVCVENPTPAPIYVYGCRFFPIRQGIRLPLLNQLNTSINPSNFGATAWSPLTLPGGPRVFCLRPWCRIYVRVPVTTWRPLVFQIAARNVPEETFPLRPGVVGPDPGDWNGEQGTMAIVTSRPTQEFSADLTGAGSVGANAFSEFRRQFRSVSEDVGTSE